ncbi:MULTISPECIES: hypothetical protein [Alteribacter]|uniref:Uncharacterized protein n=1 Tax=Alteribacter keqinensis TaxID=2483800 RepID=A0A3M7TWI5_9BACI|nr:MULTISPECIES: hypothetical protein [Alteribacter]MBM7094664.1 hypothetical protein [Alteribacter salitolerans]RNA69134.1 hypothetical protein EBO34_04050 [Alteribacter keqinensis]
MKKMTAVMALLLSAFILSGCLFPDDQRAENQVPYDDQIQSVQTAVNQYREDTQVLPIQTRDNEVSVFMRYPVNFRSLVPSYLQNAPGNSFENGGTFQYVLTNVEEQAEVKLVDLRSSRKLQEINRRIDSYRSQNRYAPVEGQAGPGVLELDYEALRYNEPATVRSPFHPDHLLPVHMATNGELVIDYSIDILYYIEEYGMGDFSEGDDLRWLLVEHAPFVPAHSKPMTIEDGEVVFKSSSGETE